MSVSTPSIRSKPNSRPQSTAGQFLCVVCGQKMVAGLEPDLWRCPDCQYQCSTFVDSVTNSAARLNETHRRQGLEALRRRNAQTILDVLAHVRSLPGARLCDIGCAYGWFLDEAERAGIVALGIEPDAPVAALAENRGLNVRLGNFPDCLAAVEQFDVLTLNDVLEHLPQIERMVGACRQHLLPSGLLAIALPTSSGAVFRIGSLLRRCRIRGPLDRLWQRSYPSPHCHYFNADNLERLLARFDLKLIHSQSLPAWQLAGLWNRLRMDQSQPTWKAVLAWISLVVANPLLRRLPSDILLQVYRRADESTCQVDRPNAAGVRANQFGLPLSTKAAQSRGDSRLPAGSSAGCSPSTSNPRSAVTSTVPLSKLSCAARNAASGGMSLFQRLS
jgi:SAM-dependent methyltransferase